MLPLRVEGLEVRRRGKRLIGPIDLALDRLTGVTVVIGPNGAGKTTLLKTLHGLFRPRSGRVIWSDDDPARKQAFVFQTPVLLRRSVLDNIAYPMGVRGMARADARTAAMVWAERVGLSDALQRSAFDLSGGERQKLALARALITEPEVLFLDEPTASLDGRSTREIEAVLLDVAKAGTRLILSTHNIGQMKRLADEVVFLNHGRVEEHSAADPFFAGPKSSEAAAFLQGDIVE